MMKRLLLMLLLVPSMALAQKYASNRSADEVFLANPKNTASTVHWIVVDDPDAECRRGRSDAEFDSGPRPGTIRACARFNYKVCTIITGAETSHAILGHEVRHCFEGRFHD